MFGVSFFELVTVLAVALIVLGPSRLPEAARSLGKLLGELHRAGEQVRRELYGQIYAAPRPPLDKPTDAPAAPNSADQPEGPRQ